MNNPSRAAGNFALLINISAIFNGRWRSLGVTDNGVNNARNISVVESLNLCGNFAYMSRFTDGLRLPSEDEAIKTYKETYGESIEELRTDNEHHIERDWQDG
jgi:hypothetical protein